MLDLSGAQLAFNLTHIVISFSFLTSRAIFNLKSTSTGSILKRSSVRIWRLSKLQSPREHTHPLVRCIKRAIDSSKQNQIKTHLQTVKKKGEKKTAPAQSNVNRLAT